MDVKGFGVTNRELENFFQNNGAKLSQNFVGGFPADQKREFLEEVSRKKNKVSVHGSKHRSGKKTGNTLVVVPGHGRERYVVLFRLVQ